MSVISPIHRSPVPAILARDAPDLAEMMARVGRCRGYALNCGVLAVLCATATSEEELDLHSAELQTFRRLFLHLVDDSPDITAFMQKRLDLSDTVGTVQAFYQDIHEVGDGRVDLRRDEAVELARRSRQEVLPALYVLIAAFETAIAKEAGVRVALMVEKAALVDGMLAEMARIGRMIGSISINASVEAARAGGESGRSFQVIAQEVRSLARQSAEVLAQMKKRLSEDAATERARLRRASG